MYISTSTHIHNSRARIGRGGRLIFDRVALPSRAMMASLQDGEEELGQQVQATTAKPTDLNVILSAGQEVPNLEKYPTMDLMTSDCFKVGR